MAPRVGRCAVLAPLLAPIGAAALRVEKSQQAWGPGYMEPFVIPSILDDPRFKPRMWNEAKMMAFSTTMKLTEDELYKLVRGSHFTMANMSPEKGYYTGNTPAITRLKLPALKMQDAGQGFRTGKAEAGTSTSFPCLLALAATWDPALVRRTAAVIAQEFVGKGANVMLGPSVNVHRVPRNGRNFEYLSGEDPQLGSHMAFNFIAGLQSQGVMATVKHFAFNEQETNRIYGNSVVDDDTAWKLYYPPFKAAIAAGVGAVMCSYNRVNGTHACQNHDLLERDLKGKMQFPGFVMSDWYATHDAIAFQKGLDQDMPGGSDIASYLMSATTVEKVHRLPFYLASMRKAAMNILSSVYRLRLDQNPGCVPPNCEAERASNQRSAMHSFAAREAATNSIILLKNDGNVLPLEPASVSSIAVLGPAANANASLSEQKEDYYGGGGSGHVMVLNVTTPLQAVSRRAAQAGIRVVGDPKSASVCLVFVATTASEGVDRENLELDGTSDILRASETCAKTVVLMQTPGAVLTSWRNKVAAVANLFLGGEETANAWAAVLFGDATPSGKLPITLPEDDTDMIGPIDGEVKYTEGLATSYRSPSLKAAYPFGHGLSYASFRLDTPRYADCYGIPCLKVNVTNTHSKYVGREVVQAYVHNAPSSGLPRLMLQSFAKTGTLKPGGWEEVWMRMYDLPAGSEINVGCSVGDIRYKVQMA